MQITISDNSEQVTASGFKDLESVYKVEWLGAIHNCCIIMYVDRHY